MSIPDPPGQVGHGKVFGPPHLPTGLLAQNPLTIPLMSVIADIQAKIASDHFEFSKHAVDQSIMRGISVQEVRQAVAVADLIEDYSGDKYGPSCLLLGFTSTGRPLHIQCTYPSRPLVKIITLYEPDPDQWIDLRTRK